MSNDRVRPEWISPEIYPFRDNWIYLAGHLVHYLDEGPRTAPVLLFIHPGPGWSFTYRYQIQHLSNQFRCIAPDLPGYGLSQAASGYNYTLQEQSRVLERFVEALDLRYVIVWANDGGGPTAIVALANHTDRVAGLVVGGTFGWSLKPYRMVSLPLRIVTSRVSRAINRYANFLARSMSSRLALGSRRLPKPERKYYTRPFKDRKTRNRPLKLFGSFNDSTTQEELDRSLPMFRNKPILIQFGEKDFVTGQGWPQRWAREFPNHRLIILPKVRHFTFEDAPEATTENFRTWWFSLKEEKEIRKTVGSEATAKPILES